MASSSDDDIKAIVDLNNVFFYTHFFKDLSDSESNDDSDLMVACGTILNEENKNYMPQWRGSMPGRQSGPQPGGWPRAAVRRLLSFGIGVVPKLFLNVKEGVWANY
jgi:hypothetical protein